MTMLSYLIVDLVKWHDASKRHGMNSKKLLAGALLCFVSSIAFSSSTAKPIKNMDQAGNSLLPLLLENPGETVERGCTADQYFCVTLTYQNGDVPPALSVQYQHDKKRDHQLELTELKSEMNLDLALWPYELRLGDKSQGTLVGIRESAQSMYSGGGASASFLHLFQLYPMDGRIAMREVLTLPLEGHALIRACFSERDFRQRRGACSDEYNFATTLRLDRSTRSGFPKLHYQAKATSFPGHVSRYKDSLSAPPLRKRDIVTVVDRSCTFRRELVFSPAKSVFVPDKPIPACEQYLVP